MCIDRFRRGLIAAFLATLGGCAYDVQKANQMPMPWGSTVVVACQGGKSMAIDFIDAPRSARVRFDDQAVVLPQVDSPADAQFSNGTFTLYINDSRAALERTGMVVRGPCAPR